jgi:hypothetical protein
MEDCRTDAAGALGDNESYKLSCINAIDGDVKHYDLYAKGLRLYAPASRSTQMRELYTVGDGAKKVKTTSIWIYRFTYFAICTFLAKLGSRMEPYLTDHVHHHLHRIQTMELLVFQEGYRKCF